jgi:hypothetical protein
MGKTAYLKIIKPEGDFGALKNQSGVTAHHPYPCGAT